MAVDFLHLLLHGVDGSLVELAQGVQGDVVHFVDWLPGLLQLQNSVSDLQWFIQYWQIVIACQRGETRQDSIT